MGRLYVSLVFKVRLDCSHLCLVSVICQCRREGRREIGSSIILMPVCIIIRPADVADYNNSLKGYYYN